MEPKCHQMCGNCGIGLHDNLNGPCACGAWHRENEIPALESRLAAAEQQAQTLRAALEEIATTKANAGWLRDIARAALNPQSIRASDE